MLLPPARTLRPAFTAGEIDLLRVPHPRFVELVGRFPSHHANLTSPDEPARSVIPTASPSRPAARARREPGHGHRRRHYHRQRHFSCSQRDDAATPAHQSLVYLAWIVGGLLSLFGAMTYAELGAMLPYAGGEYVYLRGAYGDTTAFLYMWTWFAVAKPASIAAVTIGLARRSSFSPLSTGSTQSRMSRAGSP